MAGLMDPTAGAAPEPMAAPDEEQPLVDGQVAATPEEDAANAEFIAQVQMVIYDKSFFPTVLDRLDDENPKEALANTAAMIVRRVYDSAKEAGKDYPGDIVMNPATEIYEDLADVASKFGYIDFEADPDAFEGGYFLLLDTIRVIAQEAGLLDQDEVNADFERMIAETEGGGAPGPAAAAPAPGGMV